jgi:hypothetical protein
MMKFKVVSEPSGAQVDVNGISIGKTPTEMTLECSRWWVGIANSPDGWAYENTTYEVTAYPSSANPGYSQTKRINPCLWKGDQPAVLNFYLGLKKVEPTQKLEVELKNTTSQPDSQKEAIQNLKKLREQGILSEAEYKEKVLNVIEQIGN